MNVPVAWRLSIRSRALLCLIFLPLLSGQGLFGGLQVDYRNAFPRALGPLAGDDTSGSERVVRPGEIVFRTPILYERLAILEEPLRVEEGGQAYELPAGQLLPYMALDPRADFIWSPPSGSPFCLDSSSGFGRLRFPILLLGTATKRQRDWARFRILCLADVDGDQRFETLALSAAFTINRSTVVPAHRITLEHPVRYNAGPLRAVPGENEVRVRYLRSNLFNSARFLIEFVSDGRQQNYDGIRIRAGAQAILVNARNGIQTSTLPQTIVFPRAEVTVLGVDRQSGAARLRVVPSQRAESYELIRNPQVQTITIYVPR